MRSFAGRPFKRESAQISVSDSPEISDYGSAGASGAVGSLPIVTDLSNLGAKPPKATDRRRIGDLVQPANFNLPVRDLSYARDLSLSRPWGPYRVIDMPEAVSLDWVTTATADLPDGISSQEFQSRRAVAFDDFARLIARGEKNRGTDPLRQSPWNRATDLHRDRKGITQPEADWLNDDQSASVRLASAVPVNPYLTNAAIVYQTKRDAAVRELRSSILRPGFEQGSNAWASVVERHQAEKGLTPQEASLLARNRSALFLLPSVSPYTAAIAKGIAPGLLPAFIAAVPSIDSLREDEEVRAARGMEPRVVGDGFTRWPRSHKDFRLSGGLFLTRPLFPYDWTIFQQRPGAINPDRAPQDAFFLPSHEVIVALPCSANAPAPREELGWSKLPVQLFFRTAQGMIPGPSVEHYADLSLARWWFSIALALVSDLRIIARLDSVSLTTGRFPGEQGPEGSGPAGWYAQAYYVRAICDAMANGYNALNLPWYMDPIARALYRDWFAGHDEDEFNVERDYNEGNWFTKKEQCGERRYAVLRPRIRPGAYEDDSVGQMPALLERMWSAVHGDERDPRKLEFLQRAGVALWASDAERDPYIASAPRNRGFASLFGMWAALGARVGDNFFASQLANPRDITPEEAVRYINSRKRGADAFGQDMSLDFNDDQLDMSDEYKASDWYRAIIHAPPLQHRDQIVDWRTGSFDNKGSFGVDVQGAVPLRWYLSWLREWATSCCVDPPVFVETAADLPAVSKGRRWAGFLQGIPRRTSGVILRDAKTYAMEINLAWAQVLGGQGSFSRVLGEQSENFNRSQPNAAVRTVGGVLSALGSQTVRIAAPGGVGQAAGTLAASGIQGLTDLLASAFPTYDCRAYGRDDLGRPRPSFERSYLSGDPSSDTLPSVSVPVPFGFCRSASDVMPTTVPLRVPPQRDVGGTGGSNQSETGFAKAGKVLKVGLAVAATSAVVYGTASAWKYFANKPKVREGVRR